ncbi:hypothetical protein BUALT_Bualt16G0068400 [Buddleja alternifolia]|uniref:Cell wall hydroxyproline-rich glycoprotein n=1 Tax=Buddleja alternifolia TaxID=168488 RepID=A0AAV6WBG6_9LAMI|nr:hypothetical protein BUALT_Bualt16G0068400 [Buddleja alternifolia]
MSANASSSSHVKISSNGPLSEAEALYIKKRQLLYYIDEFGDRGENVTLDSSLVFENPRLRTAYIALQAWKKAILSDPLNLTSNWVGSDVCNYTGVFCAPALDNPSIRTVAGIDLNHGDIAGYLPEELGLLTDLELKVLFELDLSNNRFAGKFPYVVLSLPKLIYLDIRFNEFEGTVPPQLFDKPLDAIFINHNRFAFELPDNFGNSPVSVIVLAHNKFHGCVPASLGNMSNLNEIILMNNGLRSCLPPEIGLLSNLTVLDVSYNALMGPLPDSIGGMWRAAGVLGGAGDDDRRNCLANRLAQRSAGQCKAFLSKKIHCGALDVIASYPLFRLPRRFTACLFSPPSPPPPINSPPASTYYSPPPPPPVYSPPPPPHLHLRHLPPPPFSSTPVYSPPPPSPHHLSILPRHLSILHHHHHLLPRPISSTAFSSSAATSSTASPPPPHLLHLYILLHPHLLRLFIHHLLHLHLLHLPPCIRSPPPPPPPHLHSPPPHSISPHITFTSPAFLAFTSATKPPPPPSPPPCEELPPLTTHHHHHMFTSLHHHLHHRPISLYFSTTTFTLTSTALSPQFSSTTITLTASANSSIRRAIASGRWGFIRLSSSATLLLILLRVFL